MVFQFRKKSLNNSIVSANIKSKVIIFAKKNFEPQNQIHSGEVTT